MTILTLLIGALSGAWVMYLLDPLQGRRRRIEVRKQMIKALNRTQENLEGVAIETRNRTKGVVAEARKRLEHEEVDDEVLIARVRSQMGRVVSQPSAVEVNASAGVVTLRGSILDHEVKALIDAVKAVSGVREVINQMEASAATNVPDFQNGLVKPDL